MSTRRRSLARREALAADTAPRPGRRRRFTLRRPPPDPDLLTQRFNPSASAAIAEIRALPDLLDATPRLALDGPELCGALDFAFAGGGCFDTIVQRTDDAELPASDWDPDGYTEDLFLEGFVELCFGVSVEGWKAPISARFLSRVIASPPADPAVVEMRREILAELAADEALQGRFESLYRALCQLRVAFAFVDARTRQAITTRRLDTLKKIREVLETAADGFGGARSELARITRFAREARASDGFTRLQEILDYENHLARVDVQVQISADGRVRTFELRQLAENADNHFHVSAPRRFWGRLMLWLRGYRVTGEELVDRWLDQVFDDVKHYLPPLMQLLSHMELYLAALAFRRRCEAKGLAVCLPELTGDGARQVEGLFNPLLFAQGITPVPCDLGSDSAHALTIITGPNSGGKTRLLQAVGLTQLLAQSGIYVPAARARLPRASGLFVSLISEVSAAQKEGRLGTELLRIRRLFETAHRGALVVLDELCSGTNPSEGEEIFLLVLTLLQELQPEAFITTHFLEFARRLSEKPGDLALHFRQVELDDDERPTYGFVPGVATTSLAVQTAARLGVTREELMALVRRKQR